MDYYFTIENTLDNIEINKAKSLFCSVEFHENICNKVPGTALNIHRSDLIGDRYVLERSYNLELDMPDIIRRLLKDNLRISRSDSWNFKELNAISTLKSNLPGLLTYTTTLKESDNRLQVRQDWQLEINTPLIHKVLAKFAESEIRKFHKIEMNIIQSELSKT
ncbi:DUF2505 domain-containing protein [Acinetobacter modestus]|uniref:DUF2505 domain-containing protein n=1 Tax=Acinetobacter modestus TaxID=1776740 RepID=UPI002030DDCB|nr:DUF2505 domain-containing protein [Acinetobacter modestus]MCM1958220.1 DUF2505 domain-containing protein [Acinetobacter modestus]